MLTISKKRAGYNALVMYCSPMSDLVLYNIVLESVWIQHYVSL